MSEIPYVCLYRSYFEELENFSPEERGRLLWALLEYLCTGQEPDLPEPERYFWPRLRTQHQRDAVRYAETCERNRANGVKGGRPKANKVDQKPSGFESADFITEKPTGFTEEGFDTSKPVAPKEREIEKEKEKEKHTITDGGVCVFPSKEEVGLFCREKGLTFVDPERFVNYYDSIGWVISGQPIRDWKSAAKLWNQRERSRGEVHNGLAETGETGGHGTVV